MVENLVSQVPWTLAMVAGVKRVDLGGCLGWRW